MINGIGVDIVLVDRFVPWVGYSTQKQLVLFSQQELIYCFQGNPSKQVIAQRLAVRFAAKEAFYKALSSYLCSLDIYPKQEISLMFLCKNLQVVNKSIGVPFFDVCWDAFEEKIGYKLLPACVKLSLAHERSNAVAFVIISSL